LGVFFTPWMFDRSLLLAGVVTLLAVGMMFLAFRRGIISRGFLASMALFYVLFAVVLVIFHI
jgi:cation:H+ antiporter